MQIKVDYSIKRKSPDGRVGMPGEFAIYTREHWWNRWKEVQTFGDLNVAILMAEDMRLADNQLPRYF